MCNLSKSKYCSAVQCPKMLWMKKFKPELFDESVLDEEVLEQGNIVGDFAMGLFGDYTEVPFDNTLDRSANLNNMVEITKNLMADGTPIICEASFAYKTYFCSVDILKNKGNNKVELYEVKSSSKGIKDHPIYVDDISYQVYILRNLGYEVEKACLVHINDEYEREGKIKIGNLFTIEDITETALSNHFDVESNIEFFNNYMEQKEEPEMELGVHCFKPYECGFFKHCSENLPKNNVFKLRGNNLKITTKEKLYKNGLISFEDLENAKEQAKGLKTKQLLQIDCELHNRGDVIDKEGIKSWLGNNITYPVYHLDFETASWAIPQYNHSKTYEQITFQFSLHIQQEDGSVEHKEFLYDGKGDPRRAVAEKLVEYIPEDACVLAYHKSFEQGRIKRMAELYDDLAEKLLKIHNNIRDLEDPMRDNMYYNKYMEGSSSIKKVLPALFPNDPELDYHNLAEIHCGTEATKGFKELRNLKGKRKKELKNNMLKYCELDTYAMVKVLTRLNECVK